MGCAGKSMGLFGVAGLDAAVEGLIAGQFESGEWERECFEESKKHVNRTSGNNPAEKCGGR